MFFKTLTTCSVTRQHVFLLREGVRDPALTTSSWETRGEVCTQQCFQCPQYTTAASALRVP